MKHRMHPLLPIHTIHTYVQATHSDSSHYAHPMLHLPSLLYAFSGCAGIARVLLLLEIVADALYTAVGLGIFNTLWRWKTNAKSWCPFLSQTHGTTSTQVSAIYTKAMIKRKERKAQASTLHWLIVTPWISLVSRLDLSLQNMTGANPSQKRKGKRDRYCSAQPCFFKFYALHR